MSQLQWIISSWVFGKLFESRAKVSMDHGHVEEADYRKQSIYSILYSLYGAVGTVESEKGVPYQFTFNTWGYAWPEAWGPAPTAADEPQRFGRNAYSGLYHFPAVRERVAERAGEVHVVELGCGTGAGADHVCEHVLPKCTYEAFDMQNAAIETARRMFVPRHGGRLVATRADATRLPVADGVADIAAVCETHVTDQGSALTEEDRAFFRSVQRVLKPGGFLVWGNAIPDPAWGHAFGFMETLGLVVREVVDVTAEAVRARHEDERRIDTYIEHLCDLFPAFRVPIIGARRRVEAELAMKNLCRHPGTTLYDDMAKGRDTYKVVLVEKRA